MLKTKIYRPIMYTDTYKAHSYTQLPQALCAGGGVVTQSKQYYCTSVSTPPSSHILCLRGCGFSFFNLSAVPGLERLGKCLV